MKSILVHADDSPGMDARREVALAMARRFGGHVTFLVNTPFYRFVAMDPFGGAYLAAGALAAAQARDAELATKLEGELTQEDVQWDISRGDGDLLIALAVAAALADLTIVSMSPANSGRVDGAPLLAGDLALASRTPVLALPETATELDLDGPAMLAWNGSAEAAAALRAAIPLLAGREVTVVRIGADSSKFSDTDVLRYLSRHGIAADLREEAPSTELSIEEQLEAIAVSAGAKLLVMGAFGHSRLRETLFGGVTRYLLESARIPLFLAH